MLLIVIVTGISTGEPWALASTRIRPVYVPTGRRAGSARTSIVTGAAGLAVPLDGVIRSHSPPESVRLATVNGSSPPPSLDTMKLCTRACVPCGYVNEILFASMLNLGATAGPTENRTEIVPSVG